MRSAGLMASLIVAAVCVGAAPASAYTYINPRYGTSATFPAEAFPRIMPPSEAGEGQGWRSDDGAEIVIYSLDNSERRTPRSLVQWRKSLDEVTYQKTGDNWAVVSGYRPDGRIFYERYIFRGDLIHSVSVRYPEALRDPYDKMLKPITESLRGPSR